MKLLNYLEDPSQDWLDRIRYYSLEEVLDIFRSTVFHSVSTDIQDGDIYITAI